MRPALRTTALCWALFLGWGCAPGQKDSGGQEGAAVNDDGGGGGDGTDIGEDSGDPPCTPLQALFFDLGDTLVTEREDGLRETLPGVPEMLAAIDARPLPLGVITNVPNGWTRQDLDDLLVEPSLLDVFDVVLLSSEASEEKPHPVIYQEAVALLPQSVDIQATAFVTETLAHLADAEPPTEGARAAGMVAVHVSAAPASDLVQHTVAPEDIGLLAAAPWLDCLESER